MRISKIILYDEPTAKFNIKRQVNFLKKTFKVDVECRRSILEGKEKKVLREIDELVVTNMYKPFQKIKSHTTKSTDNQNKKLEFVDGFEFQRMLTELIPPTEQKMDVLHIIFTDIFIGTYDWSDYRYHGRAIIGANPAIISTTGIIEAPAKPREYYIDLMTNSKYNKTKYEGRFLTYQDPRLPDVVEGYLMQVVFYYITGMPFCEDKKCRLFNAHWQEDLIQAQLTKKLCAVHQLQLNKFVNNLN